MFKHFILALLALNLANVAYGVTQIQTGNIANLAVTNAKIANSTVDLTAKVTGTLPAGNGGTGQTTIANAFVNFYETVATTLGDIVYGGASGTPSRLAGQTTSTKKFLTQTGTGSASAAPGWNTIAASDLPNPSSSTLGGVQSYAAVSNQWINTISTSGVPSSSQPAFSNLSGTIATGQFPASGVTAASYTNTNLTVDASGRITAASNGSGATGPRSQVIVGNGNGEGSTATKIRRWTNALLNTGSDITYADSATAGGTFTATTAGVYTMSCTDTCSSATCLFGITLNDTATTTDINTITYAQGVRATVQTAGAGYTGHVTWTGILAINDVLREHGGGSPVPDDTTVQRSQCEVTKVSN